MDARAVTALMLARVVLASRDRWARDELLIQPLGRALRREQGEPLLAATQSSF